MTKSQISISRIRLSARLCLRFSAAVRHVRVPQLNQFLSLCRHWSRVSRVRQQLKQLAAAPPCVSENDKLPPFKWIFLPSARLDGSQQRRKKSAARQSWQHFCFVEISPDLILCLICCCFFSAEIDVYNSSELEGLRPRRLPTLSDTQERREIKMRSRELIVGSFYILCFFCGEKTTIVAPESGGPSILLDR